MLGNITRNSLLPCGRSALLKRYNAQQMVYVRSKGDAPSSKNQSVALEVEGEDNVDQPIKFSTSKAAAMRINEYRDPHGDAYPWYQKYIVSASLAVFLSYFCILRKENDIDLILYTNLSESLNRVEKSVEDEKQLKSK